MNRCGLSYSGANVWSGGVCVRFSTVDPSERCAPPIIEERIAKRVVDIVLSALMLFVLSPLMLAAAILVRKIAKAGFLHANPHRLHGVPFRIFADQHG
jgi:lipopolysaccharide/colanic/teichoic acid biosynthesis glycosyltransferase